jgi:hypothetical protein
MGFPVAAADQDVGWLGRCALVGLDVICAVPVQPGSCRRGFVQLCSSNVVGKSSWVLLLGVGVASKSLQLALDDLVSLVLALVMRAQCPAFPWAQVMCSKHLWSASFNHPLIAAQHARLLGAFLASCNEVLPYLCCLL